MTEFSSPRITVKTTPYPDGRIVQEITNDLAHELVRQVIDTQEAHIRQALIQLGWTPPAAGPA